MIVVRGQDDKVRVLSNVCRHRSSVIAEGKGNAKNFVCPYHAWTYATDGQLLRAAHMDQVAAFDIKGCKLPELASEIWRGFIYVNLDGKAKPLAPRLKGLEPYIQNYHPEELDLSVVQEELWSTNWKCLAENFLEGYHLSTVHHKTLHDRTPTRLCEKIPPGEGYTGYKSHYTRKSPQRKPYHSDLTAEEKRYSMFFWVFPSHLVGLNPGGSASLCLQPRGTDEVDVINRPDRKTWKRLGATKGVNVQKIPASLHRTWPMHTDTAPFDNNDVRLALKYGVDRDELVEKILNGTGSVGNDHPISPVNKYFNSELPQRVYDPDKAKFHLKKAGMENLNVKLSTSEGIWEGAMDAALLYSASAAKAGIKLDVNKVPNDGYWSDVWLKHPWSAAYWSGRPTEDWMFTVAYAAGANWNESRWAHPRFNELLKSARAELNEDRARDMYWEMQQLTRDEGGTVIALFADHLIGHSDKLAHGKIAGNWELDGYRLIERWWFA